ncbi:hypothetical protein QFZ20_000304 [Flavobacterium sp. W4I14]|nr:hypothetical protein [Flavobacterium sp. W4I14]
MPFEFFVLPGLICFTYAFYKALGNAKKTQTRHDQ